MKLEDAVAKEGTEVESKVNQKSQQTPKVAPVLEFPKIGPLRPPEIKLEFPKSGPLKPPVIKDDKNVLQLSYVSSLAFTS